MPQSARLSSLRDATTCRMWPALALLAPFGRLRTLAELESLPLATADTAPLSVANEAEALNMLRAACLVALADMDEPAGGEVAAVCEEEAARQKAEEEAARAAATCRVVMDHQLLDHAVRPMLVRSRLPLWTSVGCRPRM